VGRKHYAYSLVKVKYKVKILQVNKLYPPYIGGVEEVVKTYAEILDDEGHEVVVLVCNTENKTVFENVGNIKIIRTSSLYMWHNMPISFSFFFHYWRSARWCDVIHLHEPYPTGALCFLATLTFKKKLITWHSDIVKQKIIGRLIRPIQLLSCFFANEITTTSSNLARNSPGLRLFQKKVTVLPLSIDIERFEFNDVIGNDVLKIKQNYGNKFALFVGRLVPYKGLNVLVEALRDIDVTVVIIGSGPLREYIENQTQSAGFRGKIVIVEGYVDNEELVAWYYACRFFVFPSITENEAFGIVQLEAMVCGKSVINTNLASGVPSVSLNNETGLTVTPGSVMELKSAIEMLWNNDEMVREFGINAKNRVLENFSHRIIKDRLNQIITNL
jgi:glycosyltransferase involved in cell wall biosynthesis